MAQEISGCLVTAEACVQSQVTPCDIYAGRCSIETVPLRVRPLSPFSIILTMPHNHLFICQPEVHLIFANDPIFKWHTQNSSA